MLVFQTLGYSKDALQNRSSNRCASTRYPGETWGRTFQLYPHSLIHILRELLCIYLPQECRVGNVIASPGDVFTWLNGDASRDGMTKPTALVDAELELRP